MSCVGFRQDARSLTGVLRHYHHYRRLDVPEWADGWGILYWFAGRMPVRGTLIPLPLFLDAVVRASEVAPEGAKRYLGIAVVLDRGAEQSSRLLEDLARDGSSINDVTRHDLLVALPGRREDMRGVDEWVLDPHKQVEDGVGAPGVFLSGADDQAWAGRLWELVSDDVEEFKSPRDQERIAEAVDQSASSICDYLGLSEKDIPSLVLFSLVDHRVYVFRYGGGYDTSPYLFFKAIAADRPQDGQPDSWLTSAVTKGAREAELREGPPLKLAPPSLATWEAIRYLPRRKPSKLRRMLGNRQRPAGPDDGESDAVQAARIGGRYTVVAAIIGAVVAAVLAAIFSNGFGLFPSPNSTSGPASSASPPVPARTAPAAAAAAIEQRYDGKDPTGKDGSNSKCADPPPSQPVSNVHPSVIGPSGKVVGHIELRTSPICPVIWARVSWLTGSYPMPLGWSLHIVMHRRAHSKTIQYISHDTSNYVYGNMLATVSGCVYAEVYFAKGSRRTPSALTPCLRSE